MTLTPYVYWARIDRVTDADTLHAEHIDLGLGVKWFGPTGSGVGIRVLGVNAAERGTVAGDEGRLALLRKICGFPATLLGSPYWVKLHTAKPDAYPGRLDAQVELEDGTDLATWLTDNGWAAKWDGKTQPRPVPPWPREERKP